MLALIDGDLIAYRCAASCENEEFDVAVSRAKGLLDDILLKVNATEYRLFLGGRTNFRKSIYPEYKGNRKVEDKPKWLNLLIDYLIKTEGGERSPDGLESDDMMAMLQTDKTIICSLDKDMLQVAGMHFQWAISGANWQKPDTFYNQSDIEGLRLFYEQCLKGDTSDNIKGVAKIGKVGAKNLLANCQTEQEMFDIVVQAYGNDDEFLMNAQCLWLLRSMEDSYLNRYQGLLHETDNTSN